MTIEKNNEVLVDIVSMKTVMNDIFHWFELSIEDGGLPSVSDNIEISVPFPTDEDGMLGRECLECEEYFKIKPGTGLETTYCHCPYCEYEGEADTFWTPEQIE
ncbi:MAG: hypothetical protein U5P10_00065 [Spirochaetia bacterium]|nr:hypothetical protein [Spirochaetia bacterium]